MRDGVDGPAAVQVPQRLGRHRVAGHPRGGDGVRVGWMRCGSAGPLAEPVPLDRCLPGNGFLCLGDLLADAPRGTRRARSWRYRLWVLMEDLWPWQGAR